MLKKMGNPPKLTKKVSDGKKTLANCYSITIRTGKGLNLGEKGPYPLLKSYFWKIAMKHVLTAEKYKSWDKHNRLDSHFQGGVFLDKKMRQDHLKKAIVDIMEQFGPLTTVQKSVGIVVKAHDNFDYLFSYCCKEIDSYGELLSFSYHSNDIKTLMRSHPDYIAGITVDFSNRNFCDYIGIPTDFWYVHDGHPRDYELVDSVIPDHYPRAEHYWRKRAEFSYEYLMSNPPISDG